MFNKKSFICALFILTSLPSLSANFIVDRFEDAPDEFPGNGVCAAVNMVGARCSLRAAIMEANASAGPDFILVPNGEYILSQIGEEDFAANGDLDITDEVSLINASSGFTINANGIDRVFHVLAGGVLNLTNATLTNGIANTATTFEGGAVRVEAGGGLTTDHVTFVNNLANRGGAVFNDGSVVIENSYFRHNAITNEHTPQNLNSVGSALLNRGILLFATSTVSFNGQLQANPSNAELTSNPFAMHFNPNGNNATPPSSFIFNSTLANNGYGAIRSDRGFTDINQSTIANHTAFGLRFTRNDNHLEELQLKIRKSLMVNNEFQDCNDPWVYPVSEVDLVNNYNASTDDSCGFTGMDDIENITNPINGSLHMWGGYAPTLMLHADSNAIDHAGNDCTEEDQRGEERPLDGNNNLVSTCDMGALEFNPLTDPNQSDLIFKHGFEE